MATQAQLKGTELPMNRLGQKRLALPQSIQHKSLEPNGFTEAEQMWIRRAVLVQLYQAGAEFLKIDIQTGLLFAEIALQAVDSEKRRRNCRLAWKAYDTVRKMEGRLVLSDFDARVIGQGLERLKSELTTLGAIP